MPPGKHSGGDRSRDAQRVGDGHGPSGNLGTVILFTLTVASRRVRYCTDVLAAAGVTAIMATNQTTDDDEQHKTECVLVGPNCWARDDWADDALQTLVGNLPTRAKNSDTVTVIEYDVSGFAGVDTVTGAVHGEEVERVAEYAIAGQRIREIDEHRKKAAIAAESALVEGETDDDE